MHVFGAQNVIDVAIDHNIEKVMAISSDKAVNPINLYGATKMCMEKLFIAANVYVGGERQTRMSCVRYGNVVGSRGSVIPLFKKQKASGKITITDERMLRFWITLEEGVEFVIQCMEKMYGGEIFIPKIPSMKIVDLAKVIAPGCKVEFIGIRPGEKINECLLTEDEARHSLEFDDFFIIEPEQYYWKRRNLEKGKPLPESFRYTTDTNNTWLTKEKLQKMIEEL